MTYTAAVITVSDKGSRGERKDTSGPALNILVKLMSMVAVVFTPLFIKVAPAIQEWLGLIQK